MIPPPCETINFACDRSDQVMVLDLHTIAFMVSNPTPKANLHQANSNPVIFMAFENSLD